MNRFIIYCPDTDSFVRIRHGWTSGHPAEAVNSYASFYEAETAKDRFDSLRDCIVLEVRKTVEIIEHILS